MGRGDRLKSVQRNSQRCVRWLGMSCCALVSVTGTLLITGLHTPRLNEERFAFSFRPFPLSQRGGFLWRLWRLFDRSMNQLHHRWTQRGSFRITIECSVPSLSFNQSVQAMTLEDGPAKRAGYSSSGWGWFYSLSQQSISPGCALQNTQYLTHTDPYWAVN